MSPNANRRLYIMATMLAVWFFSIAVRLVGLQVVHHQDFVQRAARQQQRSIEVSPVRGFIYDRNGNDLAMSIDMDSIYAVPSEISDPHSTSGILGKILKSDPKEIETRIHAGRGFAWVQRKVNADTGARIRALNLRGIYFQKESKRFYPKRELAAQVLGYVGLDDAGLGGIERQFDQKLKGKPGDMVISMDAKKRWFGRVEKDPDPGENIVLTIDEKIQYIAERELEQAIKDTQAEAGTIIVENPRTGEILALANRPTFNPNSLNSGEAHAFKNRAVSDIYEPGSTFKIVTLSAAIEEKMTNPEEVIFCENGSIVVNRLRIRDHHPYGMLTVRQILEHSSDVGAIKLALRLGEERFDRYIRAFGFGSQTGIELPAETRGLAKPVNRWSKVSIGAISMGQEIGVSPLQIISMVNTIANDGVYLQPRIILGATAPRSAPQPIEFQVPPGKRVISTLTAAQMKQMMESVVLRGTGTKAMLNGYSSAGKTGTAQKIDPATHTYSRSKYIASFTGFAPVNTPALTVLVVLDSPVGPHEGGQVSAPVFARVAQQILAYWNIPHDREVEDPKRFLLRTKVNDSDVAEGSPEHVQEAGQISQPEPEQNSPPQAAQASAIKTSLSAPVHPAKQDSPVAKASLPAVPSKSSSGPAADAAGGVPVPDFSGKSLRSAMEVADQQGIELEVSGSGIAQSQSPPAGAHIPYGGHVSVRFGR
jgi:cell division protein FtsI (penicillin-binding protein 3)